MHIMEGFLPLPHALAWTAASAPALLWGTVKLKQRLAAAPQERMLLGVATAFAFVLSALKLPSLTGSSSHPTGVGLGALLFGPLAMVPVAFVVLTFQALLLAHGGLTTLGANLFSMGIAGPGIAYLAFRLLRRLGLAPAVFAAAALGNLTTYVVTALQLALAFPDATGGVFAAFIKFAGIFALTQVPLALVEGMLTVVIVNALQRFNAEELRLLPLGQARESN
ncbi:MAG: energy-coupling factor ABC transporter permease [Azovibrio sp.]|nr:energy-coupling factor ABC transporter permease [Azovibrio sp.]